MPDTPRHYRPRTETITALQWHSDTPEAMQAFLGHNFNHDPEEDDDWAAVRASDGNWWDIYESDWVVKQGSLTAVMSDADFHENYEEAE